MSTVVRIVAALIAGGVFCGVLTAGAPVQVANRRPNIVIIAIDTLRADHLGCYGYSRRTSPNIDRLASDGVVFENCYSVASWTLPAFMSMFTGLMPAAHGCTRVDSRLPQPIPTLAARLRDSGYYCAAVVSGPFLSGKHGFSRGFDTYDDYTVLLGAGLSPAEDDARPGLDPPSEAVTGASVTREAKLLLDLAKRSGKPFFIFVHYFDPHVSYIPPQPYGSRFDPGYEGTIDGTGVPTRRYDPPPKRDLEHLIALYDGEIAYTDRQVGDLLDRLEEVCEPSNTLTILVSDHGEAFGEHGMLLHGNSAYREEVFVPMIWRWPSVLPSGHRIKAPVSNLDITKSLKELIGCRGFDLLQGESLWPGLLGGQLPGDRLLFSQKAFGGASYHVAATKGKLRLHVRSANKPSAAGSTWSLYDISTDPWEQECILRTTPTDLAAIKDSFEQRRKECEEINKYYRKDTTDTRLEVSDEQRRRLRTMGYINKGG